MATAAIFSPSVARAAASQAKDWAYIDSWLKNKYQALKRSTPSFERNPEILKALLALASHNEAADEEREQLSRIEQAALDEVKAFEAAKEERREIEELDGELIADDILAAIEDNLPSSGQTALNSMAQMAVELGEAYLTPEKLGCKFVELQGRSFELDQTVKRVAMLQRYLERESKSMDAFMVELQGDEFRAPDDLAKQNLELKRQIKTMTAKITELQQQLSVLQKSVSTPKLTVEDVKKDEEEYLQLLSKKKELDTQIKAFAGLPSDVEAARVELEALRTELRDATVRRDSVFEGLVERESPVKIRRRP